MNQKYAIVYSSRTGNTAALSQAIQKALPEELCVYCGAMRKEAAECTVEAQLIFVGFWTDKGTCDETCGAFLKGLGDQSVALYGTAGFGGSAEYYGKILGRAEEHVPAGCSIRGTFMCQGKMPVSIRDRYEKMKVEKPEEAERFDGMIANFDEAMPHPDEKDLNEAAQWARKLWEEIS